MTTPLSFRSKSFVGKLTPSTDFTAYWLAESQRNDALTRCLPGEDGKARKSVNEQWPLELPRSKKRKMTVGARACVCSCYHGRYVSGTFRTQKEEPAVPPQPTDKPLFRCAPWSERDPQTQESKFLIETSELVESLWTRLGAGGSSTLPSGLVVFAGSTSSGKSNLAMAFALRAILHAQGLRKPNKRLPHLVTLEDPIEIWRASRRLRPPAAGRPDDVVELGDGPEAAADLNFCFTPREKGIDVADLAEALSDAKRQTPTCFYIGEVRNKKEWREVIDFAGTGHLVVTTTHAARLSETVARIVQSQNANTPAERRKVGGYLTACVHLQQSQVELVERARTIRKGIIFPTVWVRQGAALSSLVADGLSSVTPNGDYVLSKLQFMEASFRKNGSPPAGGRRLQIPGRAKISPRDERLLEQALAKARELDIEELLQK